MIKVSITVCLPVSTERNGYVSPDYCMHVYGWNRFLQLALVISMKQSYIRFAIAIAITLFVHHNMLE